MPPCHPSVPLMGNIPPMWSTFVLGGHLWQWLTVTRAKTMETINRNPDILGSKVNKLDRDIPASNLFHCTVCCQFKIIRFVFIEWIDCTSTTLASLQWKQIFEINHQQIHFGTLFFCLPDVAMVCGELLAIHRELKCDDGRRETAEVFIDFKAAAYEH